MDSDALDAADVCLLSAGVATMDANAAVELLLATRVGGFCFCFVVVDERAVICTSLSSLY
jgi:Flp pilus assembly protein protease CpaA